MIEENYENWDVQKLKAHLTQVQSILQVHAATELQAIKSQSATDLLQTFQNNSTRMLNPGSWDFLDIKNLDFNQVDFLELVISLPEFQAQQKKHHLNLTLNWLEACVKNNLKDENFVQYFYHHEIFNPLLKECIQRKDHLALDVSQKTVEFLLQKNLITISEDYIAEVRREINQSPDCHSRARMYGYTPYIEYGLKNGLIKTSQSEIEEFYTLYWPQMTEGLRQYCREEYRLDHLSLNRLLGHGHFPEDTKGLLESQKLQIIISYSENDFYHLLQSHTLSETDITLLCRGLKNSLASTINEKEKDAQWQNMTALVKVVKENAPLKWDVLEYLLLEDSLVSEKTREKLGKILLYVKMNHQLITQPENEAKNQDNDENPVKMKI